MKTVLACEITAPTLGVMKRLVLSLAAFAMFAARAGALTPDEIEKRVALSAPSAGERRLDEIGWAADIRTALQLAKEHQRPVFLFTHDGRMAVGRC